MESAKRPKMGSSKLPESWEDLPQELCREIAERLAENEMDHLHFRSICKDWRSSTLPLLKHPLPSFPHLFDPPTPRRPSFVEKAVYLLQIPEDLWELPHMKEFKRSFLVKVSKPFSSNKIRIESLLSHTPLENRENPSPPSGSVLSLWNLRVTELHKVFYSPERESGIFSWRISKAGGQLTAMAIHTEGLLYQYKSGENDQWIQNGIDADWDDTINYQGQFCAVDIKGRTVLFDSLFAATEISSALLDHQNNYRTLKRLVESRGELFLVELYKDQPKIFRLNMEEKAWIQVENLGDHIFFFADDCSFSLSAREFPECKGNCVYFKESDEKDDDERLRFCGPSTQVYDLETGKYGRITSFPEHLKIFWPPPKWLEDPRLFTSVVFETMG